MTDIQNSNTSNTNFISLPQFTMMHFLHKITTSVKKSLHQSRQTPYPPYLPNSPIPPSVCQGAFPSEDQEPAFSGCQNLWDACVLRETSRRRRNPASSWSHVQGHCVKPWSLQLEQVGWRSCEDCVEVVSMVCVWQDRIVWTSCEFCVEVV